MDLCTKKLGMQIELHRNNVYQGVELLLLVSMLFLLAIPKCLLTFKENFYYTSILPQMVPFRKSGRDNTPQVRIAYVNMVR